MKEKHLPTLMTEGKTVSLRSQLPCLRYLTFGKAIVKSVPSKSNDQIQWRYLPTKVRKVMIEYAFPKAGNTANLTP